MSVKRQRQTVSKARSLSKPIFKNRCRYAAGWIVFLSFDREQVPKNQGALEEIKKEQVAKKNSKGVEKK